MSHIMKYIRIKYLLILVVLCLIEGNLNVEAMLLYLLMLNFMLIFLTQEHKKKIPQSLIDKDQDILNEFKRFACQK